MKPIPFAALVLSAVAFISCETTERDEPEPTGNAPAARHPALLATAYPQQAAEYRALAQQVFQVAASQLDAALADPKWSALPGEREGAANKPPAVIVDVDETILDNTPWQVRAMRGGYSYPEGWQEWCMEGRAQAIPGALAFARFAASKGVTIFYVSNRKAPVEEGTRANLKALGFPLSAERDTVLLRYEKEEWGSDKTTRRELVATDFRVVMMFGDNLGDFLRTDPPKASPTIRAEAVDAHASYWGTRWFVLPNAMYGSWEGALLEGAKLSGDERHQRLLEKLDAAEE